MVTDNDFERTIVLDPGDHIGAIYVMQKEGYPDRVEGTTIVGEDRLQKLWSMLNIMKPHRIIFERFALRASAAKKLVGNTFITCEVIGVIKLYCQLNDIKPVELQPMQKEYCGFSSNPKDPKYKDVLMAPDEKITEHVRDAYRLWSFYKLFGDTL